MPPADGCATCLGFRCLSGRRTQTSTRNIRRTGCRSFRKAAMTSRFPARSSVQAAQSRRKYKNLFRIPLCKGAFSLAKGPLLPLRGNSPEKLPPHYEPQRVFRSAAVAKKRLLGRSKKIE